MGWGQHVINMARGQACGRLVGEPRARAQLPVPDDPASALEVLKVIYCLLIRVCVCFMKNKAVPALPILRENMKRKRTEMARRMLREMRRVILSETDIVKRAGHY